MISTFDQDVPLSFDQQLGHHTYSPPCLSSNPSSSAKATDAEKVALLKRCSDNAMWKFLVECLKSSPYDYPLISWTRLHPWEIRIHPEEFTKEWNKRKNVDTKFYKLARIIRGFGNARLGNFPLICRNEKLGHYLIFKGHDGEGLPSDRELGLDVFTPVMRPVVVRESARHQEYARPQMTPSPPSGYMTYSSPAQIPVFGENNHVPPMHYNPPTIATYYGGPPVNVVPPYYGFPPYQMTHPACYGVGDQLNQAPAQAPMNFPQPYMPQPYMPHPQMPQPYMLNPYVPQQISPNDIPVTLPNPPNDFPQQNGQIESQQFLKGQDMVLEQAPQLPHSSPTSPVYSNSETTDDQFSVGSAEDTVSSSGDVSEFFDLHTHQNRADEESPVPSPKTIAADSEEISPDSEEISPEYQPLSVLNAIDSLDDFATFDSAGFDDFDENIFSKF